MKKVLVLIPDGVSLRNFLFTDFPKEARASGIELIYWNATSYDISADGEKEIKLNPNPKALTDLYKRAKIHAELDHFQKIFDDPVYEKYRFQPNTKGLKNKLKNLLVNRLRYRFQGEEGLELLRERMRSSERKSEYYKRCREVLEREKPGLVFCVNQRPVNAIAPVIAASDLGIPTACFIFSWDNLPKATKVIDTDYYFVWSDYMKNELLSYYPYIQESKVNVTGSPQFEIHYKDEVLRSRDEFFSEFDLDLERKYLCFSGDDVTTSPHDEVFLRDVAEAVRQLNTKGENIGIIFRRCPVDLSQRYDPVLKEYSEVIRPIEPVWTKNAVAWDAIMPTREDMVLQTNIVNHSFLTINVGSSMVFDFVARNKPCAYLNYRPELEQVKKDIREVYNYVHFSSMPERESVFWVPSELDIKKVILKSLENANNLLVATHNWFDIINQYQVNASSKIVENINGIIEIQN